MTYQMVLIRELVVALHRIHGYHIFLLKLHSQNGVPQEEATGTGVAENWRLRVDGRETGSHARRPAIWILTGTRMDSHRPALGSLYLAFSWWPPISASSANSLRARWDRV
jgi:hypothetical protein